MRNFKVKGKNESLRIYTKVLFEKEKYYALLKILIKSRVYPQHQLPVNHNNNNPTFNPQLLINNYMKFLLLLLTLLLSTILSINPWQGAKDPMRFRRVIKCPRKRPTDCSRVRAGGIPTCAKDSTGSYQTYANSCEPCRNQNVVSYTKGPCVMA